MSSTPSVTIDYVLKKMLEQGRSVFYLEDATGNVMDYNEDMEVKVDAAMDRLESSIAEISGNYCYVRLHSKGGGGNKQGGKQVPVLRYKVFIGGGSRIDDSRSRNRDNGLSGGNMGLGLMEKFFTRMSELEAKLITTQKDAEIAHWKERAAETKENSHEPAIDLFVKKAFNKYVEYENLKGATEKTGKTVLADDAGKEHLDETNKMLGILQNFLSVEKDLDNLELLSGYIKDNPEMYRNVLNQIKEAKAKAA